MKNAKRPKEQMEARADVFDDFGLGPEEKAWLDAQRAKKDKEPRDFADPKEPRQRSKKSMTERSREPEWYGVTDGPE